jgi:hypothetical protein
MTTRPVRFGHLVPKFRSEEALLHELDQPDGLLRRYDGQRTKPLLPPPKTQASLGLSFVLPGQDRHLYEAVAWAGYWLKREFGYDWALFQPEIWLEPGWREAFIYVVDTERGVRVVGAGACQWAQYSNLPAMRELAFAWFHPHFRRRGYLSGIWPAIARKWGPFILQHPVSEGMRNFLARQTQSYVETTDGKADKIETYG